MKRHIVIPKSVPFQTLATQFRPEVSGVVPLVRPTTVQVPSPQETLEPAHLAPDPIPSIHDSELVSLISVGRHETDATERRAASPADAGTKESPTYYTVKQFAQAEPAFTEPAIRNHIFEAVPRHSSRGTIPGNGLIESGAILRIGRKVMIHKQRFLAWIESSSAGAADHG